jgi:palmitoyl transferase
MQRWGIQVCLAVALACGASAPVRAAECADLWDWVNTACRRLADTYKYGSNELLLSGYAWHVPWTWTSEARAQENEYAWGGGWARTTERDNGDSDTVYFLVFSDSHKNAEFNLGYAWSTYWGPRDSIQAGLGYTVMIIQRPDIANGIPFPAILPLFSLRYQKFTLVSTFIPTLNGGINNGSVLYVFGKIALD